MEINFNSWYQNGTEKIDKELKTRFKEYKRVSILKGDNTAVLKYFCNDKPHFKVLLAEIVRIEDTNRVNIFFYLALD